SLVDRKPALELPLLRRLLVRIQQRLAGARRGTPSRNWRSTGRPAVGEIVRRLVQTFPVEEAVLQRITRGLLQFGVGEVLVVSRLYVLMGEVNARDALIV